MRGGTKSAAARYASAARLSERGMWGPIHGSGMSNGRNANAARRSGHGMRVHDIWIVVAALNWRLNSTGKGFIVSPVDYTTNLQSAGHISI